MNMSVGAAQMQDAISREASRISAGMNNVAADHIMVAQQLQAMSPDQATMTCVIAHAFSLQRLLHYPGLDKGLQATLAGLAKSIMDQDTPGVAPTVLHRRS